MRSRPTTVTQQHFIKVLLSLPGQGKESYLVRSRKQSWLGTLVLQRDHQLHGCQFNTPHAVVLTTIRGSFEPNPECMCLLEQIPHGHV